MAMINEQDFNYDAFLRDIFAGYTNDDMRKLLTEEPHNKHVPAEIKRRRKEEKGIE